MCGIFGLVNKDGAAVSLELVRASTSKLAHRGPDGEGYFIFENIGLGHRRLTIIELTDAGAQPMSKHGFTITYNGEIYNYRELREELQALGYSFNGHSDTEVLLSAYDCWGAEAMHKLSGMWAFIIYDARSGEIIVSRDHWGMKPLFIYEQGPALAFASEIRAFTCIPQWDGEISKSAVYDFLVNGELYHNSSSFYEKVSTFPLGTVRKYSSTGDLISERNFQFATLENIHIEMDDGRFKKLFSDSVSRHFVSDVPVACALSGGLDSSSVVREAYEQHLLLGTFSFSCNEPQFSEYEYVEILKKGIGISNHKIAPSFQDHLNAHLDAIRANEAPALAINLVSSYLLYKEVAARDYKILLAGQGADELLLGYHFYFFPYIKYLRKSAPLQAIKLSAQLAMNYPQKISSALSDKRSSMVDFMSFTGATKAGSTMDFPTFYQDNLHYGHLHRLLIFEDHLSMAHGVEARLPFLDQAFSQHAFGLDFSEKIKGVETKHILRRIMRDRLPNEILDRKDKMGFVSPQESWIYDNADFFISEVNVALQRNPGWVKSSVIPYITEQLSQRKEHQLVWRLYSFFKFLDIEL